MPDTITQKGSQPKVIQQAANPSAGQKPFSQTMADKFAEAMGKGVPKAPAAPAASAPAPEPPKAAPAPEPKPDKLVPEFKQAAPAPPEPPPSTPEPEPEIPELDEHADPKVAANFKTVREITEKYKKEAQEYKAKLVEYEKKAITPQVPADYEALKAEREEIARKLQTYELAGHPLFQAAFNQKQQGYVELAKGALGEEKAGDLGDILTMKPGAAREKLINQLAEDLEPLQLSRFFTAYQNFQLAEMERATELKNPDETLKKIKGREAEFAANQQQLERNQRLVHADNELSLAGQTWEDFRPKVGDEAHNKTVSENQAYVRQWMENGLSPDALAKVAVWAVKGIRSVTRESQLLAKIQTLESQVSGLSGSQPSPTGGGTAGAPKGKAWSTEDAAARFQHAMKHGVPAGH